MNKQELAQVATEFTENYLGIGLLPYSHKSRSKAELTALAERMYLAQLIQRYANRIHPALIDHFLPEKQEAIERWAKIDRYAHLLYYGMSKQEAKAKINNA